MFLVDYHPSLQRKMDREEGRKAGRKEGRELHLISQIQTKIRKGISLKMAAEALEENTEDISEIYEVVKGNLEKDPKEILDIWNKKRPGINKTVK